MLLWKYLGRWIFKFVLFDLFDLAIRRQRSKRDLDIHTTNHCLIPGVWRGGSEKSLRGKCRLLINNGILIRILTLCTLLQREQGRSNKGL